MTEMKKANPLETQYVILAPDVLAAIATTNEPFQKIKAENLCMRPAEVLVPLRFFNPNAVEHFIQMGATPKEVKRMETILGNPYRLVIKGESMLSNGVAVDNSFVLYDVLENFYLEMGLVHQTQEIIVVDSYYRHNDLMTEEERQTNEENLVKLMMRTAIVVTHYLTESQATIVSERVKWLKSPFATLREKQMKAVYRNRYQQIQTVMNIDLSQNVLGSEEDSMIEVAQLVAQSIEIKDSRTDEVITSMPTEEVVKPSTEKASETPSIEMTADKTKATVKKPKKAKAKKEETVLEVLEDGTKIVQYERAGYWRTQKNKETGEEKKIWIEPKLMTRRVAAK